MNTKKKHLVIIGGGPAGALAAYLLASNFEQTTLIEKRGNGFRKICGEYLCPPGVELLKNLGMASLLSSFQELRGMEIYSPAGKKVQGSFPLGRSGLSLNRAIFDESIRDLAQKRGATVYTGHTLTELKQVGEGWRLVTDKGLLLDADFVIGADGVHSYTAKLIGVPLAPGLNKKVAIHAIVKKQNNERFGRMHILSHGMYIGVDPVNENEINYSLVMNTSSLERGHELKLVISEIHKKYPLLDELYPVDAMTDLRVLSPLSYKPLQIAGSNYALVGDASGFIDPLTGEGIYNALLSSSLLAESVKSYPGDLSKALKDYAKKRSRHLQEKERLNKFFQWLIHFPWACELVADFLSKKSKADVFIQIIGNIYTPKQGIKKLLSFY